MKRGYSKILYNQRNKDETIVSVIKRLFGEHISSRLIRMQNRELTFRCITYNLHRMLNLIIIKWILQSLSAQKLIEDKFILEFSYNDYNKKKIRKIIVELNLGDIACFVKPHRDFVCDLYVLYYFQIGFSFTLVFY
jgi:hypothetical protein